MQLFKNILVGVDLAQCRSLDLSGLTRITQESIHWAVQLARVNAARLLFFSATDIGEEALLPLDEEDRSQVRETVFQGGSRFLEDLARQAAAEGVEAQSKLVSGEGWYEIIRQVIQGKHDLVVGGTRDRTGLRRMLFGSAAMKLMRRCPCPVLITKPGTLAGNLSAGGPEPSPDPGRSPFNILVATDLRPSSESMLRLGIALANQMNAHLYVLHVVEYQLDDVCNIGLPDKKQDQYRRKVRAHAEELLHAQLDNTNYKALGPRLEIHLSSEVGVPDVAIQHFLQGHQIHLLIMGTIARGGIRGIMIGDTAERLLPEVHCSVLAVKPADFVCPVDV